MAGKVFNRYILEGIPNVSYAEYELQPLVNKKMKGKAFVKNILKEKGGKLLIRWQGYSKDFNSWENAKYIRSKVPEIYDEFKKKKQRKK